jgi:hypothetical protein
MCLRICVVMPGGIPVKLDCVERKNKQMDLKQLFARLISVFSEMTAVRGVLPLAYGSYVLRLAAGFRTVIATTNIRGDRH